MIQIKGVQKSFSDQMVLKDINIDIKKGEIFGIVGQSGAGKSTLLRCLNALESYDNGSICVMGNEVKNLKGMEIREFRKNMGMIFQGFNLLMRKNVIENIMLPMEIWKYDKKEATRRAEELIEIVGLTDKIISMPRELSGGQKQRVAIARALSLSPQIILCDEATSALDPGTTKSILKLLSDINKKLNITIVVVTHQMEVIKEICHSAALMDDGRIISKGKVEELFLKPDEKLKMLLAENEVLPKEGVNIKIYFTSEYSQKCVITSMARYIDIDFSIVWGKLENFRDDVVGSLIINANYNNKEKIVDYLKKNSIYWEVV